MLWMNSSSKAYDWTLLGMKIKNCFLNHSKPNTWAYQRCLPMINIKGQNSQDACLPNVWSSHFKQIPKDHNQGLSLPSASPSHFKQRTFHHNQGSSISSLKHPKWTKKKQVAHVKIKVCLFIPCFYVSLTCSIWCTLYMYII